jgi:hypothetical protein
MGCDYYVNCDKPVKPEWICYACGEPIDISSLKSLADHEGCARERNGKWMIPVTLEGLEKQ